MNAETCQVEVWVVVDAEGQYAVGVDAETARRAYANEIGALEETEGFRLVKVGLTVPMPAVAELSGVVPVDAVPTGLTLS